MLFTLLKMFVAFLSLFDPKGHKINQRDCEIIGGGKFYTEVDQYFKLYFHFICEAIDNLTSLGVRKVV